jgi:hypothetical protein
MKIIQHDCELKKTSDFSKIAKGFLMELTRKLRNRFKN